MNAKSNLLMDLLHTATLCTLALGQPLFDLLARNVEFFVVRRSEPVDVLVLALALGLLPAVLLTGLQAALLGRRGRRFSQLALVALLGGALALHALKRTGWESAWLLLGLAGLLGVAGAALYLRLAAVRLFLTALSPAVLVCPAMFLFDSQVSKIVRPAAARESGWKAAAVATRTPSRPVVVLVFDEFPLISLLDENLQVDAARYPHFAALARGSIWFRNATTVHQMTTHAVPALLTGRYPDWSQLPIQADYPENLFTWLGDLGGTHRLKVFEPVTRLCPASASQDPEANRPFTQRLGALASDLSIVYLHLLLPGEWSNRLPTITHGWKDFRAGRGLASCCGSLVVTEDRPRQFQRFLDALGDVMGDVLDDSPGPTLYFLHLLLPHSPFSFLPSGKHYGISPGLDGVVPPGHQWGTREEVVNQTYQRHLLQVGYADALLGRAIDRLKQAGLYDRCLLVVTADHGISFQPGDSYRHLSATNYPDILRVPLFIKKPHQKEGVISDRKVQLIDVLPTMAKVLGEKLPWPVDGRSALDLGDDLGDEPGHDPEPRERVCFNRETRWTFGAELEGNYGGLRRKLALFGSGSENGLGDRLFRAGPHPELVGKLVTQLPVADEAGIAVEVDKARFLADVNLKGNFLPAHLKGAVYAGSGFAGPLDLAVALNGTICTVARSFDHAGGAGKWTALLPESAFRQGKNELEVFIVRPDAGGLRLYRTLTPTTGDDYRWDSSANQLIGPRGEIVPIVPRALQGHLDYVHTQGDCLEFGGWAAWATNWATGVQRGRLPKVIAIFADGRFVQAVRPNSERTDLVQTYGHEALRWAGFRVSVPAQVLKEMGNPEVRLFAVGEEAATELAYPTAYKKRKHRPLHY